MSIQRHSLSPSSVKSFPKTVDGNQLIFETKALSSDALNDGKSIGEVVISATVAGVDAVEIGRQKLIPGDRPRFLVDGSTAGPFYLSGELFPWVTGSYLVTVWDSTVDRCCGDSGGGDVSESLLRLNALPVGTDAVAIAPGQAIFTAGETAIQTFGDETTPYRQTYTVDAGLNWGVGVRSFDSFESGRVRFGAGSGRAVLGLSPQFESPVNFRVIPWAWYVHSSEEVRVFDYRNGAVANVAQFQWSPDKDLALRVSGGKVIYEIQEGDGWASVYESPNLVLAPVYFCAVLGPQAFVFNCTLETNK